MKPIREMLTDIGSWCADLFVVDRTRERERRRARSSTRQEMAELRNAVMKEREHARTLRKTVEEFSGTHE